MKVKSAVVYTFGHHGKTILRHKPTKKMENYYKAEVHVDTIGFGTCDLADWIRKHNYPTLDCTKFIGPHGEPRCMVSYHGIPFDTVQGWHEVEPGFRRKCGWMEGSWVIDVDGHYYFVTSSL